MLLFHGHIKPTWILVQVKSCSPLLQDTSHLSFSPRSLLPEHTLMWPGNTQVLGIHLTWNMTSIPAKALPPFPYRTILGVNHQQQNPGPAGFSQLLLSLLLEELTFQGQQLSEREKFSKNFQNFYRNDLNKLNTSVLRQLIALCTLPEICSFFLLPCCYKASVRICSWFQDKTRENSTLLSSWHHLFLFPFLFFILSLHIYLLEHLHIVVKEIWVMCSPRIAYDLQHS